MASRSRGYGKGKPTLAPILDEGLEPEVLPVFYYNDLIISRCGDPIGLNLFEPRYQHMCRRMAEDPRFIFMPNYDEYCCHVGDVGFVVRLVDMRPTRSGFGIQGFAESRIAVACTWVEPNTSGLHFARFWPLPAEADAIHITALDQLYASMTSRGWSRAADSSGFTLIHPDMPGTALVLGMNWPDSVHLMLRASDPGLATAAILEAWSAAFLPRHQALPRFEDFVMAIPAPTPSVPLVKLCAELVAILRSDGSAAPGVARLLVGHRLPWRRLLKEARIATVHGASASLPTARLELRPWQQQDFDVCRHREDLREDIVHVGNQRNVYFYATQSEVEVTAESAQRAIAGLLRQLNDLALRTIARARNAGCGPLAALEDGSAQLVCEYVAFGPQPL
eukprot:CAMPEP_0117535650 /NCGR_PEP_ID=MMETSP0784-20121206/41044_1 /TAXON_ID=39447 /ORGANISM="" /LENGTH=392 /DNA_ID=CAMNT_0005332183 /DNA_START=1 /DNA_END=1179 /DNA_ORIENTATION=-